MALASSPVANGSVLCLRALGLGDFLTALPALRGLSAALPEHRILLAAPKRLAPLAFWSGAVDDVIPTESLSPLVGKAVPALAVNLHGCGPKSHRVLMATAPRRLIAFRHESIPDLIGQPRWEPDEHEVARWCRLLAENEIATDPACLDLPKPPAGPWAGAVVIHPGAASGARRWPAERWSAIAGTLHAAGWRIALTGSRAERALATRIAADAELADTAVLAGSTDLIELSSVVAHAAAVICGDTGVAHLATAFGTPSVVLFGPTSPARWGPPSDRPRHVVLWAGSEGDPHSDLVFAGLLEIGIVDVLRACASLRLASPPSRAAARAPFS